MRGQQAFFDVRLFDPNANRCLNKHKHYFNSTSKMKKEETKNTMKEFQKLIVVVLFLLYSQFMGVWEDSVL